LSAEVSAVCFVAVPSPLASLGLRISCVSLAGTIGALGMLGHRRGAVGGLFAASGQLLMPSANDSLGVLLGLAMHCGWILVWSFVLAAVVQRRRGSHAALIAAAVALIALGVSVITPAAIGGPMATLPIPARALVHGVMAISFVIGMRLAPGGDGPGV
jgi:hypothetical protein